MSASPGLPAGVTRTAAAATLAAAALIAQQVAGRAVRDALYLGTFPVSSLPLAMTASAVVSLAAVLAFARLMTRFPPGRVVPTAVGVSAALLVSEWALAHVAPRAAAVAVYAHMAFFGATLVSGFWSLVNESFDPYTAKHLMGRIGAGASVGGVLGGALAWSTARAFPAPAVLLLMTLLHALAGYWLLRLGRARRGLAGREGGGVRADEAGPSALALLRRTPYLRELALLVAVSAAVEALLDYHLNSQAAARYAGSQALVGFFSAFHTATGLAAVAAQTLLSGAALETLGLAGSTAVRPALVLSFGVLAAVHPQLWTAALLRGAEAVSRHSLFRSGYELLFTPLPPREKRATKAVVDVGFDRLGTAVGGAVAFLVASLGLALGARVLPAVAALAAAGALVTALRLQRGYVRALEASLRQGLVALDPEDVRDPSTRLTLANTLGTVDGGNLLRLLRSEGLTQPGRHDEDAREARALAFLAALRAGDPSVVRQALARDEARDPRFAAQVVPLLARDDVALEALHALRRLGPRIAGTLTDALVDPASAPVVRRRVARALKGCGGRRAAEGLLLGLDDEALEVRRACGQALVHLAARGEPLRADTDRLFALAARELAAARASAARDGVPPAPGSAALRHVFTLLALALDRESMQVAFRALHSGDALRGTALEYLETVLPEPLRRALFPLLGALHRPPAPPRPRDIVRDELVQQTRALRATRQPSR